MINFNQIVRRVEGSKRYIGFKKENKDAYLSSAFFILDFENNVETKQLDYFIPSKNKIASFLVDNGIKFRIDDIFEEKKKTIEKINSEVKVGLSDAVDTAKEVIKIKDLNFNKENLYKEKKDVEIEINLDKKSKVDETESEEPEEQAEETKDKKEEKKFIPVKTEIQKIIAILQVLDGKQIWNLTCMAGMFDIFMVHIDSETGKVIKNEKCNINKFLRQMPGKKQ